MQQLTTRTLKVFCIYRIFSSSQIKNKTFNGRYYSSHQKTVSILTWQVKFQIEKPLKNTFSATGTIGDRIKGLKLRCIKAYCGGAAVHKRLFSLSYIAAAVHEPQKKREKVTCVLRQLFKRGKVTCWLLKIIAQPQQMRRCGAATCRGSSTAVMLQLAVVGKIQLAEVPQFEPFYTVPKYCTFFLTFYFSQVVNILYLQKNKAQHQKHFLKVKNCHTKQMSL